MTENNYKEELKGILAHYAGKKDELIPILQEVQERFRYLPADVMLGIGKFLRVPPANVFGVSTFYAQFKHVPYGKNVVRVCRGTACHVRGSPRIVEEAEKKLGVKPGQTSPDLEYSLETIACFGSCALAPVMVVNNNVYGRMTPAKVRQILDRNK